jgi:DNA-binding Lrp family transcriptional regulator
VVATTRPSGALITAASSPGPSSGAGSRGSSSAIAAIRPNSPSSATVMTSSGHVMTLGALTSAREHPRHKPGHYGSVGSTHPTEEDDMVHAYILVQTEVGKAAEVASHISKIAGVMQADDVTGPYDVIVRAEADNVDDLGKMVVAQIQGISGITRTLTCPIVHI